MKEETKSQKFQRLAATRINKIVSAINTLGNLSNTSQYDFTSEEVGKIIDALNTAVEDLEYRFGGDGEKTTGFSF